MPSFKIILWLKKYLLCLTIQRFHRQMAIQILLSIMKSLAVCKFIALTILTLVHHAQWCSDSWIRILHEYRARLAKWYRTADRRMFELGLTWNCINFWILPIRASDATCSVQWIGANHDEHPMRMSHVVHNYPIYFYQALITYAKLQSITWMQNGSARWLVKFCDKPVRVAIDHEYVPCSKWADNLLMYWINCNSRN